MLPNSSKKHWKSTKPNKMIRAVLDTNILISGILTPQGNPGKLIKKWKNNQFILITSEPIIKELVRVTNYPKITKAKPNIGQQTEQLIDLIFKYAIVTLGKLDINLVPDDPTDNKFVAAAIEGAGNYLISGDKHLKKLSQFHHTKVITPKDFISLLI